MQVARTREVDNILRWTKKNSKLERNTWSLHRQPHSLTS